MSLRNMGSRNSSLLVLIALVTIILAPSVAGQEIPEEEEIITPAITQVDRYQDSKIKTVLTNKLVSLVGNEPGDKNRLVFETIDLGRNDFYTLDFEFEVLEADYSQIYYKLDIVYFTGLLSIRTKTYELTDTAINHSNYHYMDTQTQVRSSTGIDTGTWLDGETTTVTIVLEITPGFNSSSMIQVEYELIHYAYEELSPDLLQQGIKINLANLPFLSTSLTIEASQFLPRQKEFIILTPPSLLPQYLPLDVTGKVVEDYTIELHVDMSLYRSSYSQFFTVDVMQGGTQSFVEDRTTIFDQTVMKMSLKTGVEELYTITIGNRGNDLTVNNLDVWIQYPDVLANPFAQLSLIQENLNFILGTMSVMLPIVGFLIVKKYDHNLLQRRVERSERVIIVED